jgi:hypothetical protein
VASVAAVERLLAATAAKTPPDISRARGKSVEAGAFASTCGTGLQDESAALEAPEAGTASVPVFARNIRRLLTRD